MKSALVLLSLFSLSFALWDTKVHNINNVEITVTNYGIIGQASGQYPGCNWPKGSGHNYIFGAGIWFGAIDSLTNDTLVSAGYEPHGAATEFAPGLAGQDPADSIVIIYLFPDPWPAPLNIFPMAPQIDISHQDSWCCYNDSDSTYHIPGDTRPIGIEVYQTVYDWDTIHIQDVVYFTLSVKNVLGQHLKNCYIGFCTDCDIGNEAIVNDRTAGIVGKWYVIDNDSIWVDDIGYQWQEQSEPGWAEFPGVIGFDLLQTPFDLVEGQDKDNDGIPDQYERDSVYYVTNLPDSMWDVDSDGTPDWRDASENPQLGMTAFKRFTLGSVPQNDIQRYLTLAGYNFQNGQYEPYDTAPSPPDDQRFLMSSGPFDLEPDSSVTMVFAIMFSYWHDSYNLPDTALALIDKWVQGFYDLSWHFTGIIEHRTEREDATCLRLGSNPVRNNATIYYSLSGSTPVTIKLYNIAGQLVRIIHRANESSGSYKLKFETQGLAQGIYFISFCTRKEKFTVPMVVVR